MQCPPAVVLPPGELLPGGHLSHSTGDVPFRQVS